MLGLWEEHEGGQCGWNSTGAEVREEGETRLDRALRTVEFTPGERGRH